MKNFNVKLNNEPAAQEEQLISYTYCGGIYTILIALSVIYAIRSFCFSIVLIIINSNPAVKLALRLADFPMGLFIGLMLFFTLVYIALIVLFSILHYRNCGTNFTIYEDRIEGVAKIQGNVKARIELPMADITDFLFTTLSFKICTKSYTYSYMMTSRDFKRNLMKLVNSN